MEKTPVLFVHGFQSGRGSSKWAYLQSLDYIEPHMVEIDYRETAPLDVIGALSEKVDSLDDPIVVGHSLGGFFARAIRLRRSLRALLINPSLRPDSTLFGHGERSLPTQFHPAYKTIIQENLPDRERLSAEIILIEYGDEVVDHRSQSEFHDGSLVIAEPGGSHKYEGLNNIDTSLKLLINRPWQ